MSTIEEIEQAVEQLPLHEFVTLAGWFDQRRLQLPGGQAARDHSAFLGSYSPQYEGLYDDATSR